MKIWRQFIGTSIIFISLLGLSYHPVFSQNSNTPPIISTPKTEYSFQENPTLWIQNPSPTPTNSLFGLFSKKPQPKPLNQNIKITIKNSRGQVQPQNLTQIDPINSNLINLSFDRRQLSPGKYHVQITTLDTGQTVTQDFTWGVLALNPDRSTYQPGETARLALAVLDDNGAMVCDARLTLKITSPSGNESTLSSDTNKIVRNPECRTKEVTLIPDYETNFPITELGTYRLELTAVTPNGTHTITDSLISQANTSFTIQRLAATRIYPPNRYPVTLKITSSTDFVGTITDIVPSSFSIYSPVGGLSPAIITTQSSDKLISWPVNIKAGIPLELSYSYLAPQISPEFYLLGPIQLANAQSTITDVRQWQIASDNIPGSLTVTSVGITYWTIPTNVYSVKIEAWGGGGSGGGRSTTGTGGGGGGGAYANKISYTVTPGDTLPIFVGNGGVAGAGGSNSWVGSTNTVLAQGGSGVATNSNVGATGGLASASIGDTKYSGGIGATGTTNGGGGGGGAGDAGNGGNGRLNIGGTGGAGIGTSGGVGGAGRSSTAGAGFTGAVPGAGGGGARHAASGTYSGGAGKAGIVKLTYVINEAPNTPTHSSPPNGSTNVAVGPTLVSSAFSDPDSGDTHSNSQWQVSTDSGFGSVVWDSGTTNALTTVTVNPNLSNNTVYWWHVRHQDNRSNWSSYSTGTSFTTIAGANQTPTAPTSLLIEGQSSPALGLVDTTPEFSAVYNDPDASDTANKYQIQVDDDSGFGSALWDSGASGTSMTNCSQGARCSDISYAGTALTRGTTYYWRIKFWDTAGSTSPWSAGTPSFTINSIPLAPSLISPGTGTTNVSQTPKLMAVTTDADANTLQYQFKICTNSAMTTGCNTFDASQTGWSGADVGTSSFSSGTTAAYTLQAGSSLSANTLYYWQSQAIDPAGSNILSDTQAAYSFTTLTPNQTPTAPTSLLIEGQSSPALGLVDTTPEFSAVYNDPDASDTANKYQIQVDDDSGFGSALWDSGASGTSMTNCSQGARCSDISYAGTALTRGTTYYWRIKFWDTAGSTSPWSAGTPSFTINQIPATPTNSSPSNAATNQSRNPTLTASTFTDPDSDTHAASQWQLATDSGFTSIVWDSGTDTTNKTSVVVNSTNGTFQGALSGQTALAYNTQYYFRVRYQDNNSLWSNYSTGTYFTTLTNSAPNTPTNSSPPNGSTNVAVGPTLVSSAFSDPDAGDTHSNSQWQVATDSGFSTVVWNSGTTNALTTVTVGAGLSNATVYWWHVRHQDNYTNWSNYSTGTSFTTVATANQAPNTPTNSSPSNGASGISLTPTLTGTTFTDPDGGDTQAASQFQLATDSGFISIVFDTGTSGPASNSTTVSTTLSVGTTYFWHVRYQDNNGAWSSYSATTNFTTNRLPSTPTNSTPGTGTTNVSVNPSLTGSAFSDPDISDTHAFSQWLIATDSGFSDTVFNSGVTSTNKTSITANTVSGSFSGSRSGQTRLDYSSSYYWKVRYQDNSGNWSAYSSATTFTTQAPPPPQTGNLGDFVRFWKFDEGRGSIAYDQSLPRQTASFVGSPSWTNNGQSNRAINFNGSTDGLNIGSTANLDFGSTSFSITAWIYPTSVGSTHTIFSNSKFTFYLDNGVLKAQRLTSPFETVSGGSITTNRWYHVALTRSGTGTDEVKLYINGFVAQSGQLPDLGTGATSPAIAYRPGLGKYFSGIIDEVKIYPRAISGNEIKTDQNFNAKFRLGSYSLGSSAPSQNAYNAIYCVTGDSSPCAPPIAEWKLDEAIGTTAFDSSLTGNSLTLGTGNSTPLWSLGQTGRSLQFDGSNDTATVISPVSLPLGSSSRTVSGWIYLTSTPATFAGIFGWGANTSGNNSDLIIDSSRRLYFWANTIDFQTTLTIPLNQWTYVGYKYDGTNISVFANNLTETSTKALNTSTSAIRVGYDVSGRVINGKIDQVRIYNYARTSNQIAWDYNQGKPLAYYKFDECSGIYAYDWSKNNYTATLLSGPSGTITLVGSCASAGTARGVGATARVNSGFAVDSTDDYASVSNIYPLFQNKSFSVSAWVKFNDNSTSDKALFYIGSGSTDNILHILRRNNLPFVGFYGDDLTGKTTLSPNVWYHIAVTWDNITKSRKLYVNGKLDSSDVSSGYLNVPNSSPLEMGRYLTSAYLNGVIDEFKVYSFPLSEQQVKTDAANGSVSFRQRLP